MKFKELLSRVVVKEIYGNIDVEITGIEFSVKKTLKDKAFFVLNGDVNFEIDNLPKIIITEQKLNYNVPQIIVENIRANMAIISSEFFNNPADNLKLIGVTGTNGKTSITYVLKSIFETYGKKVAVIGTSGAVFGTFREEMNMTTPDPFELHSILRKFCDMGAEIVVMEVSAHSLYFNKIEGLRFEIGIFTNLTHDHLDFFNNIDNYYLAKKKFFDKKFIKTAVINLDDNYGVRLFRDTALNTVTYGIRNPADVFAINISCEKNGLYYILNIFDEIEEIKFKLAGRFNVYNTMASAIAARVMNVPLDVIKHGIEKIEKIDGRFEIIENNRGLFIVIDYAHTPDGVKNILEAIKEITLGNITCVMGCGGNRDKEKRSEIAEAIFDIADFAVLTSDNPRFEDPMDIIDDMLKANNIKKDGYIAITDRKKAIEYAINKGSPNDAIVILGKGNEKYIEIMGEKFSHNDYETVNTIISN